MLHPGEAIIKSLYTLVHLDISLIFAHVSHLKTYVQLKFKMKIIYSMSEVYLVVPCA